MPRPKLIETPEKLRELFERFKKYRKSNGKMISYYSKAAGDFVEKMVEPPLTWKGFEIWLRNEGVVADLGHYEANTDGAYDEYRTIIRAIKDEIYDDKYIGATSGIFKENIIARDLGLMERTDHTTKGEKLQGPPTRLEIVRVNPKDSNNEQSSSK